MPQLIGLLVAIAVFVFLMQSLLKVNRESRRNDESDQLIDALQQQVKDTQQQLAQLEKRLGNVEAIVTDSQFVDPPLTGREAIDLQAEIQALKEQLKRR